MRGRVIVVVSVALAACKGDRAAPERRPPIDAAVQGPATRVLDQQPSPRAPRPPVPRVLREQLLDAGKAPRARLRYRPAAATQTLLATSLITGRSFDGSWREPITLAPVREGFAVEGSTGGGPLRVRGLVAEIDRDGQPGPALAAAETYVARWRALVERRRADVVVDARGLTGEVTLAGDTGDGVGDARDELVQRWVGLVVPLPEAAIGVGARWKVVTALRAGGAAVTQSALYRLVSADGDRWVIEVELDRLGRPQAIDVPGLPAGATAELVAMVRKVTGTVTVTPASALPIAGELAAEVRSHARFSLAGAAPRDQYSEDTATITLGPAASPSPAPAAPAPPPPVAP